jgi:glycosidase
MRNLAPLALAALALAQISSPAAAETSVLEQLRSRLPEDEIVYFLLPDRFENGDKSNDRGSLKGDRLVTGFDPTSKAFHHGGDLKGLTQRLDYIQALGATAVWVTPVFKNKPVSGPKGQESSSYHGYFIADFTRIDPHLGSEAEFAHLVDAVHARGMKLYLDIVVNHTADVIKYRECPANDCPYRSHADYPYTRRGGLNGAPINDGFEGDSVGTVANFAKLTRPDYAYTPYVPKGEEHAKVPDWLNDPIYYHNRGNADFSSVLLGESGMQGDFGGLDDVMTEHPRVIAGMIDIYGRWIDRYGIDGYRVDTEQHVDPAFWRAFVPAMLARAKAKGIPNFHIFGENYTDEADTARLARHSVEDKMSSVLDFAFAAAVHKTVAGNAGTVALARVFADDVLYDGGAATARRLPIFVSNHDMGRFAWFVQRSFPHASEDEVIRRVILAHAMMFTLRGVPVVYYGDEQGFPGTGGDQAAREDMFASKVALYNSEKLLGTDTTTATAHFGHDNPIFHAIAELANIRKSHKALAEGVQLVRAYSDKPGLFAVSRIDPDTGREIVAIFNTATNPLNTNVEVATRSRTFASLHGNCAPQRTAPGSYHVELAPLDYTICAAGE